MPGVGAAADKESMELLSRLNVQAKNIRSKRIQEKEDRERERFAECLRSESSVEEVEVEVQEVVPPTPSKFLKY